MSGISWSLGSKIKVCSDRADNFRAESESGMDKESLSTRISLFTYFFLLLTRRASSSVIGISRSASIVLLLQFSAKG